MQLYYVTIQVYFEMTCLSYEYNVYFNSRQAMLDFKKYFLENKHSSLKNIVKSGKAEFNSRGILIP